jgi:class 3 adenylate cyclase
LALISRAMRDFFLGRGGRGVAPRRVPVILSAGKSVPATADITPGKVVFEVRNAGELPAVFGILQLPDAPFQRPQIRFTPSLSGKRLLMTQTFRDFFRSEVIRATEGIAVRDATLVFTDLKGSTALYERIGDLNAYIQVQRHFQHLLDATVRHHGTVTKTIGDAVMAAFETPADAVRAAFDMREAADQLNRERPQRDFILKIGVHRGASIAVTLNERLDYFGQTVNIAARVQNLADGDEICITEDMTRRVSRKLLRHTRWQRAKRNSGESTRPCRSIIWLDGHPSGANLTLGARPPAHQSSTHRTRRQRPSSERPG